MTESTLEITRLNWSTLRYMATSPKLLRWRVDHPRPESEALRLGRAIHCAVLEPDVFSDRWLTSSTCKATTKAGSPCGSTGTLYLDGAWYCRVKGHAPNGAGQLPDGKEVITEEELAIVRLCSESVRAHPVAARLLTGGHSEHEVTWDDAESGVACRGRMDYLRPSDLVDLKSTRRETVREFMGDAARHLYHGQLAWYHDGAIAAGKLPKDAGLPYIVSVSTVEPYDVAVYRLSPVSYAAGQILYRDLLRKYVDCRTADWWPGAAPDLVELDLPNWAPGMAGPEEENGGEW